MILKKTKNSSLGFIKNNLRLLIIYSKQPDSHNLYNLK